MHPSDSCHPLPQLDALECPTTCEIMVDAISGLKAGFAAADFQIAAVAESLTWEILVLAHWSDQDFHHVKASHVTLVPPFATCYHWSSLRISMSGFEVIPRVGSPGF